MSDLKTMLAKQEIAELHYKYAQAIDKNDWALFQSIVDKEIIVDYSRWGMGGPVTMTNFEYADLVKHLFSTESLSTQHYMTNPLVEMVDETNAKGEAYVYARHYRNNEIMSLNAYYACEYKKTNSGWLFTSIEMNPRWDEGADVVNFFQIPDTNPTGKTYLFVTATPIMKNHESLERYVKGVIPMLLKAGGSKPKIIKQDKSVAGHTDTFMSMIVEFEGQEAKKAAHAVFESEEYKLIIPDRDMAFSKMNIAFYSDMPQV
ncbi:MAG: nuclear transport factor 2 family protein [Bacteroidota bacterium]